jgi:hypothetical protein
MQRRLPVPHADSRRVEIGARFDKRPNNCGRIRLVPGPIREKMQRRPPAAFGTLDHAMAEPRIDREQLTKPFDLALLKDCQELDGDRIITSQCVGVSHFGPV